ncbi:Pimeloyl-ACP methyl ester carboxylesterase [Ruegeria halocynthiae]|uniref:Pimeloyl-ACP methyl ester carboxylesterase n=1 Tax=Ruegeria halocynthiae TaxID=985054 RepID=A0A1H3EDF7_9RHOB|nr:alpha/beta hydrolase [Ruegeria halocynthiae]SDX76665.1 Pimeloyl-ACP methyl ester carboxylesterase [Ruegeria halocynthiae]
MKKVVFCHGMPGSTADAELLSKANPGIEVIALNLLSFEPKAIDAELCDAIDALVSKTDDECVHVVGFSIGAMAAIKVAASRPNLVCQLTLISPAAPLFIGDFLPKMAGKSVFELAMKRPRILRFLTCLQSLLTRFFPETMVKVLFAKCGAAERVLLEEETFNSIVKKALSESFVQSPAAYLAFISAYVADWSETLSAVQCDVVLWHGTNDTWSPVEMSHSLKGVFGENATINLVQGAEHYSTLIQAEL